MKKFLLCIFSSVTIALTFCNATTESSRGAHDSHQEIDFEDVQQIAKGSHKCPPNPKPIDCEEVMENGNNVSGIYRIWPRSRVLKCDSLKVYCDMETDGGGWTVIQRRGNFENAEDYFNQNWDEYKNGFGRLRKEFWLGNNNIMAITNQGTYSVRFDMRHRNGTSASAVYDSFWIEGEEQNYRLHLLQYSGGDAGEALSPHHLRTFYTKDKPNIAEDVRKDGPRHQGGWWFNIFPSSNLNGLNKKDNFETQDGIQWNSFGGYANSMAFTEIKVRSVDF